MMEKASIKENTEEIRNKIEEARKHSPYGQNVILLAATKTVSPEIINYATGELGIHDIGENRVQELLEKYDKLNLENVNLHFIGQLQTNKVKYIIDKVCMIHSVDSVKLAKEIDKQSEKHGKITDILIEINSGNEENKGGIAPDELEEFIDNISDLKHIRIRGLMTIAPICKNNEEYCNYFTKTYQLAVDILPKKLHNINDPVISMGMSDSYEAAIECGANIVRIGTSIFGRRK